MPRRHKNAREKDKVWSEEYVKKLNQMYASNKNSIIEKIKKNKKSVSK